MNASGAAPSESSPTAGPESMPLAPRGRDALAALLWVALPLAFVLGIDALGLPYKPLEGAPEKEPSYALIMAALIAAGGGLGSLFGLGVWLIPGRLLSSDDFRLAVLAALRRASPEEIQARGTGRLLRAGALLAVAFVVIALALGLGAQVFVPVLAAVGLFALFALALFGATAQRAARHGDAPRRWTAVEGEPIGEDALELVRPGPGRKFSRFVWRHSLVWFIALVVVGTAADQASKVWAQESLTVLDTRMQKVHVDGKIEAVRVRKLFNDPRSEVHVIPKALSFKYAENPAAAFSLTGSLPEWVRRPFLVGVSTLAMLFIGVWFFLTRRPDGLLMTAFALIIAGAVGNLIDRVRFGYVVDFINAYAGFLDPRYVWPTFNIADSCIVVGALSVVYRTLRPLYPEVLPEPEQGEGEVDAGSPGPSPAEREA